MVHHGKESGHKRKVTESEEKLENLFLKKRSSVFDYEVEDNADDNNSNGITYKTSDNEEKVEGEDSQGDHKDCYRLAMKSSSVDAVDQSLSTASVDKIDQFVSKDITCLAVKPKRFGVEYYYICSHFPGSVLSRKEKN